MKKALVGCILFFGFVGILKISEQANHVAAVKGQEMHAAAESRPRDLGLLKRPLVRAACTAHSEWSMETCQTIDRAEVEIGMTADQVELSWGKPERINASISARADREQWVYSGGQYLYLEHGVLKSMQSPR